MKQKLEGAIQAMRVLRDFDPRLAGALADGVDDGLAPIVLHVHAEHPDSVRLALSESGIPTRDLSTRLHFPRAPSKALPGLAFLAGDQEFWIWIFDHSNFRQRLRVGAETEPSTRLKPIRVEQRLLALS